MSILYFLLINGIKELGEFKIGRFIDLLQFDIITGLLIAMLVMEVKRWKRLKDL